MTIKKFIRGMMQGSLVFPIFLLCLAGLAVAKDVKLSCFVAGECTESPHVGGDVVESQEQCLELCKYNQGNLSTESRGW